MTIRTPNDGTTKAELGSSSELAPASWLEEAEAALRHIKSVLDMIGGRSDTVPLIVHRAEMELKKAIEMERRSSSNEKVSRRSEGEAGSRKE